MNIFLGNFKCLRKTKVYPYESTFSTARFRRQILYVSIKKNNFGGRFSREESHSVFLRCVLLRSMLYYIKSFVYSSACPIDPFNLKNKLTRSPELAVGANRVVFVKKLNIN